MAMYKMNKILQRMVEKREKEIKANDGSSGSPVSEETSANVKKHMNQRVQWNWRISIIQVAD